MTPTPTRDNPIELRIPADGPVQRCNVNSIASRAAVAQKLLAIVANVLEGDLDGAIDPVSYARIGQPEGRIIIRLWEPTP